MRHLEEPGSQPWGSRQAREHSGAASSAPSPICGNGPCTSVVSPSNTPSHSAAHGVQMEEIPRVVVSTLLKSQMGKLSLIDLLQMPQQVVKVPTSDPAHGCSQVQ